MEENLEAARLSSAKRLFAIKETHTREDWDGRTVEEESIVRADDGDGELVLFTTESAAAEWMVEQGYQTLDQVRSEYLAASRAQYAKDLRQYEKDLAEVQKMRAVGVSARFHPRLSRPTEPGLSKFWSATRYHEVVTAAVVR